VNDTDPQYRTPQSCIHSGNVCHSQAYTQQIYNPTLYTFSPQTKSSCLELTSIQSSRRMSQQTWSMTTGNMDRVGSCAIAMLRAVMLATASPPTPAKSIKKYTIFKTTAIPVPIDTLHSVYKSNTLSSQYRRCQCFSNFKLLGTYILQEALKLNFIQDRKIPNYRLPGAPLKKQLMPCFVV